jgi:hypothetical protein
MATIYKFIVEDRTTKAIGNQVAVSADGVIGAKQGAGTKMPIYTGSNKGVEHNRYMRAFNPILNNLTGGYWEKGNRMFRASGGVIDTAQHSGWKSAALGVGAVLIYQFIAMEIFKAIQKANKEADQSNQANLLKIRSGLQVLGRDYQVQKSLFGKISYAMQ